MGVAGFVSLEGDDVNHASLHEWTSTQVATLQDRHGEPEALEHGFRVCSVPGSHGHEPLPFIRARDPLGVSLRDRKIGLQDGRGKNGGDR